MPEIRFLARLAALGYFLGSAFLLCRIQQGERTPQELLEQPPCPGIAPRNAAREGRKLCRPRRWRMSQILLDSHFHLPLSLQVQTRNIRCLPDVLVINCEVNSSKEADFWKTQAEVGDTL